MYGQIYKSNKIKAILHAYQINKQIHFSSRLQLAVPPNGNDKEEMLKPAKVNVLPKSLPFFRKKFVKYYKASENLPGNLKKMKDYYRNLVRAGPKKSLLILERKYNEYDKVFENYTGLDKDLSAQSKNIKEQNMLTKAQDCLRQLENELTVIQKELGQIQCDIAKCDRDDSRHLDLVKQKNDKIAGERKKLENIKIAIKEERDLVNKNNELFSKFDIKEIKEYCLNKVDNSKSLPFFRKKFVEYYKVSENLPGNETSGQKKSLPLENLLSKKTNPLISKFNITDVNNYSNKLENSKSLPVLRKKIIESYHFCENIWDKNKVRLGQKSLPFLQFEDSPNVTDKGVTKENKSNPSLSKANLKEMKDYYRNLVRTGQKKSLLILQIKFNEYNKVFENYTGLDKVFIAQSKSTKALNKLTKAQDCLRRLKNELTVIQKELGQIQWNISKCDRDESRYLDLVNQENDKILEEREKLEQIKIAIKDERDLFSHLNLATKISYERERAHTKKYKILSRTIKLIIVLTAFFIGLK